MRRQFVLHARPGPGRIRRLGASALAGCALIVTLLAGSPSAADAADTRPTQLPGPAAVPAVAPAPVRTPVAAEPDADPCGGSLTFGQIVDCPALATGERDVYTLITTVDKERVASQLTSHGVPLQADLKDSGGNEVCALFSAPVQCVAPKAGTYTIVVVKPEVDTPQKAGERAATGYLLGIDSWTNPSSCVDLPDEAFATSAPGRDDRLAAGSAGRCYRFDQPAGAVVRLGADGRGNFWGAVENATGQELCQIDDERCPLVGPGPYRLFLSEWGGDAVSYHLSSTRLSDPVGCVETPLTPFGAPEDRIGSAVLGDDVNAACRTFTAAAGQYLFASDSPDTVGWKVLDSSGKKLTCATQPFGTRCTLPSAGTYTATLTDASANSHTVRLAIYPLAGTEGCESVLRPAWNSPLVKVTMRSPLQIDCHGVEAEPGDHLRVYTVATTWLTNGAGAEICAGGKATGEFGCTLTGTGPYRLITIAPNVPSSAYTLHTKVLADAAGCIPARPGRYGALPAGELTAIPCRALLVSAAGRYRVELVNETNDRAAAQVVDGAGHPLCDNGWCSFPAAGRYKLTSNDGTQYYTVFLPEAGSPGDGCTPVSDDPTADPVDLALHFAGEYDCFVLPTPVGARLALSSRYEIKPTAFPEVAVYDATGAPACDLAALLEPSCVLRGTAPFRVIAHDRAGKASGANVLSFVRTDRTAACPNLAAGSFATTASTKITLEHGRPGCFTVPASDHSGAEMFSISHTAHPSVGRLSVFGADGRLVCRSETSFDAYALCRLGAGPVTVLVDGFGSFAVARRDVTATAPGCGRIGSTAVGAPTTKGTLTSDMDVHCYRVAADPADQVMINEWDAGSWSTVLALDANGAEAGCGTTTRNCSVTGHAGYQILVWGSTVFGDHPFEIEAWKVWTADGPPKECQAIGSSAYGFGPYNGTLDASKRAVCAVTTRRHGDDFAISVTNPVTPADGFSSARMYAVTGSAGARSCAGADGGHFTCPPAGETVEPTVFLLKLGDHAAANPYRWEATCVKPLCGADTFTVTAVSPTALVGGATRTITLSGTSLHARDTVRITPSGGASVTATVKTVSADRTAATADVDLAGVADGPASVEIRSYGAGVAPVVLTGAVHITTPSMQATTLPSISGRVAVGEKVTASTGAWSQNPTSYAYQWAANGVAIKGATGRSYVIQAVVRGKRISVRVTASLAGYAPGVATSAASAPVGNGAAPKAKKAPVITGTAKVGRTVRATTGTWSPRPDAYRYEWRINGRLISGANRATLKLTASMRGKALTVTVIAVKKGHADGKARSRPVTVRR